MRADKDSIDYQVNLAALQLSASDLAIPAVRGTTGKALTQSFFGMNSAIAFSPKTNSFN